MKLINQDMLIKRMKLIKQWFSHIKIPYDFLETPHARLLFHIISFVYLELLFRIWIYHTLISIGTVYSILFALPAGTLIFVLSSLFHERINRILSWVLILIYTLFYVVQVVYFAVFRTFLSLYSVTGTSQVLQFWQEIFLAVFKSLPVLIPMFVPLVFMLVFGFRWFRFNPLIWKKLSKYAGLYIAAHLFPLLFMWASGHSTYSPFDLYFNTPAPELSVQKLGLMTSMRLDFERLVTGFDPVEKAQNEADKPVAASTAKAEPTGSKPTSSKPTGSKPSVSQVAAPVYKPNIMNIDFNKLIAGEKDKTIQSMHRYFSSVQPTMQNKYTGMFKDCNLIFITAESYSHYAIDKNLTPTLYKLANEGFQFRNFYNPVWGVSTSDGEYVACTGLIPKSGVWSFNRSSKNWLPFVMGNQFKKLGVTARAYHDHTYTYYGRNESHPNMGYIYKGLGNGLNIRKTWPESDIDMINVTTPEYINDKRFHTYYMTVSGHLNYTFAGNFIANKNKELVKNLPYSDKVKAYLACNIELDRALKLLLQRLDEAGKADKTVIVMSPDHYPYGLSIDNISELAGHPVEKNFELYKSSLVIYKKGMKPVAVDRVCSSLDIIPTVSNLFGLEYDSRLLMGQDILSDVSPLVIFSNRSWITDKAKYNAPKGSAENLTNSPLPENYVSSVNKIINDKFRYSAGILDKDYYRKVVP